jgi:hypothetical protein
MYKISLKILIVQLLISILFSYSVKAAFNEQINFQGKLTDANNLAVPDGYYNIEFKLWTHPTSTSASYLVWTETATGSNKIQVSNGLFSHLLGSINPLPDNIFNQPLWLGVNVGGTSTIPAWDGEMSPRKKIGAVPAAFEAKRLGGKLESEFASLAENENITGAWNFNNVLTISTSSASTTLVVNQSGTGKLFEFLNLGIPIFTLNNNGDLVLKGDFLPVTTTNHNLGSSTYKWNNIYIATANIGIGPTITISSNTFEGAATTTLFTTGNNNQLVLGLNGNVGIGLSSPQQKLTVSGNIGIQANTNSSIGTLDNYALSLMTNNIDRLFITNDGNVGINTNNPDEKLTVIGGAIRTDKAFKDIFGWNTFAKKQTLLSLAYNIGGLGSGLSAGTNFNSNFFWSAYDATSTNGLDTSGYVGAVFDGRYIYFVPLLNSSGPHANILRYDTTLSFTSASSWSAYDASNTNGLDTTGYAGAVFDGRYIYFVPLHNSSNYHANILRYDTTLSFTSPSSWSAYDASNTNSLDTRGYFGAVFDGRYIYFVPNENEFGHHAKVLRYDTTLSFTSSSSWSVYDASNTNGLDTTGYAGAVFDGRYIYFVPHWNNTGPHANILRYDTTGSFTSASSWSAYDASNTNSLNTTGYIGAVFDGRYIYFVPYNDNTSNYHAKVLRYDTTLSFTSPSSWSAYDASNTNGLDTTGYVGAVFDGRYIYFAPFRNANILRYYSGSVASQQGILQTARSKELYLDSSNNIGIGTTNPSSLLELYKTDASPILTITAATSTTYSPQIAFRTGTTTLTQFTLGVDIDDSNKFKIATSTFPSTTVLTIDQTGNIGIGTTNPSEKLHILGNALISGTGTFNTSPLTVGNLVLSDTGLTASRTFTFPDVSDTLVSLSATQTLTNKTLGAGSVWNGNVISTSYGGTGLSSIGTANQILGVNNTATGLEYKDISSLLTAGTGISITGTTNATISNTGILSLTAGSGISISSGQNPTITNTGVISLNSATGTLTLQGTTNQINVSTVGSTITLSTPQDIHTGASPTFSGLTLSSLTPGSVLFAGSGGVISQNNSKLFWDNTNLRFGIGTSTPAGILHISTGTINALVVNNSGNVGIGTTTPISLLNIVQTSPAISDPRGIVIDQYSSDNGAPQINQRKARGTPTAPSAVLSGDILAAWFGRGYDGSGFSAAQAALRMYAAENWTTTAHGTYLTLETTPIGSTTLTERMRIDFSGNIGIGTTAPEGSLDVAKGAGEAQVDATSGYLPYGTEKADLILERLHSPTKSLNGYPASLIDFRAKNTMGDIWSVAQILGVGDLNIGGGYGGGLVFLTSPGGTTDPAGRRTKGSAPVTRMVIDASGNVGIGTTAPAVYGLHIGSGVIGGQAQLRLDNANGNYGGLNRWTNRLEVFANDAIGFSAGSVGANQIWITSAGNVGIGTTNPSSLLELYKTNASPILTITSATSTTYSPQIAFRTGITPSTKYTIGTNIFDNKLKIVPGSDISTSTGITIDSIGNIGIGTTTTFSKLTVAKGGAYFEYLDPPLNVSAATTTGGNFSATGTYYYVVTALDANNLSSATSSQVSCLIDPTSTACVISWSSVQGATKYRVWRGQSSGRQNQYFETTSTSYTDTGLSGIISSPSSVGTSAYFTGTIRISKLDSNLTFTATSGRVITVDQPLEGVGANLTIQAGGGSPGGLGPNGTLTLTTQGTRCCAGGAINIITGVSLHSGPITMKSGDVNSNGIFSGSITIQSGNAGSGGNSGQIIIQAGTSTNANAGDITIAGGTSLSTSSASTAGNLILRAGDAASGTPGVIRFITKNLERMRINASGNIGIGTTTPLYRLDVSGSIRQTNALDCALNADTAGQIICTPSSQRYKTNIQDLNFDTNKFLALNPKSFDWNTSTINFSPGEKGSIGFIAEDVNKIFPEIVRYKDDKPEGVKYELLPVYLFKIVKDLILGFTDKVKSSLSELGIMIENGIAKIEKLFVKEITIDFAQIEKAKINELTSKKFCLEGDDGEIVCIDKNNLKEILNRNNIQSNSGLSGSGSSDNGNNNQFDNSNNNTNSNSNNNNSSTSTNNTFSTSTDNNDIATSTNNTSSSNSSNSTETNVNQSNDSSQNFSSSSQETNNNENELSGGQGD